MICKKCGSETDVLLRFCKTCGEPNTPDVSDLNNDFNKHKTNFLRIFGIVILFMLAISAMVFYFDENNKTVNNDEVEKNTGVNKVRQEYIQQIVEYTKKDMTIPSRIDELTTIVDITAEPNSIKYHYVLDNSTTTDSLTESYINSYLKNSVCNDELIRVELIDQNIDIEYSYTVKNSDRKLFFKYTKQDCE